MPGDITGPIDWYKFDENTGTTAADTGSNNQPGTLTNGATWSAPGLIGTSCLSLDGVNDYVDLTTNGALSPPAMSFGCRIKPTNLTAGYVAIYSRNQGGGVQAQLFLKSNGKLAVYLIGSGGSIVYDAPGSHTLSANTEYHVGFSYDSTSGLVVYVNGASDGTAAAVGTIPVINAISTIGTDTVNAGRFFPGKIDDARIYNRALTAADFAALSAYSGSVIPVITSSATATCLEGTTAVTTVTADGTPAPTFSITGGADQAKFSINSSSGALVFAVAPDYEVPTDANTDNDYVVQVTATNVNGTGAQTITVGVRNNTADDVVPSSDPTLQAAFTAYGTIGSCHFGMMTYITLAANSAEIGLGADSVNLFNPGAGFSWLPYLQKMKNIGCKAVLLTSKHVDGFCLWPSTVASTYCVSATTWYASNGQIDLVQLFYDQAHSLGLDVGFYFAMFDTHQKTAAGGAYNGVYRTAMYGLLNELLTRYPLMKFVLLDGWGDTWPQFGGPGFVDIPYSTVYSFVKARLANCLVGVNDHEIYTSEFSIYEGPADGEPAAGLTTRPTFYWQPIQATNKWFSHTDSVTENIATGISVNIGRRDRMHSRGYVWGPNVSPSPTGVLTADLVSILDGMSSASSAILPYNVDADHTWQFEGQTTAPNYITEAVGFIGLLAMDFTEPMPTDVAISSISAATVAGGATKPAITGSVVSYDQKKALVWVDCSSATVGTYTFAITIGTTDTQPQTIKRYGRLVLN